MRQQVILPKVHTVKQGDTLWSIGKRYGMTVEEVLSVSENAHLAAGRMQDALGRDMIKIQPGQQVMIPASRSTTPYSWRKETDYGTPLQTMQEYYDSVHGFNQGSYDSLL